MTMDPELERTLPSARHLSELRRRMEAEPVDVYDLTAHLETEGINDTVALSRYRVESTFELAHQVFEPANPAPATTPNVPAGELGRACVRAIALLVGSALIGLLAVVTGLDGPSIVLATSVAWISSQGGSAVAWTRVWGPHRSSAIAAGARWSLLAAGVGGGIGLLVLWLLAVPNFAVSCLFLLGVLAYSMTASLLMVAGRAGTVAAIVAATGVIVAVVQMTGMLSTMATVWACTVALAALLALVCRSLVVAGRRVRLGRMDVINAAPPTVQAALLAGGTVVLVAAGRPVAVLPLVAGVLAAVAACDPMSVVLRGRLRGFAQRLSQLAAVTRRSQLTIATSAMVPGIIYCAVAGLGMGLTSAPARLVAPTLVAGALYVVLVGYSTVLRAFGCAWLSTLVVLPALVAPLLWLANPIVALAAAVLGIAAAAVCVVKVVADPRRFL